MMMQQQYDLAVIGAGPGGYVCAIRAAGLGLKVALIEKRDVGGTCLNRGCIPTKALLHTSGLLRDIMEARRFGIQVENAAVDIQQMYHHKEEVVNQLRGGVEMLVEANGIRLIRAKGHIAGPNELRLDVDPYKLTAKHIVIATGSAPSRLPIEGADLPGVVTSDELLQAPRDIKRIVIIGGGVIGMEFASIFNGLGCEVVVIEFMDRVLPTMDREISQNLNMIAKKRGMELYTSAMVNRITREDNNLNCHFVHKGRETTAKGDCVLLAVGRRPVINSLFDEGMHVEMERGGCVVDNTLATSVANIYAIGDVVNGSVQLAHAASAQGIAVAEHIAGIQPSIPIRLDVVPSCIYTDPEIASVGITTDSAKAEGRPVIVGKAIMNANGKTVITGQDRGFIKLIFDAETKKIIGAHLMCARATDLISELTTAIVNGLTVEQLVSVIRPHPTFTEAVTEAVENAAGTSIHTLPKRGPVR